MVVANWQPKVLVQALSSPWIAGQSVVQANREYYCVGVAGGEKKLIPTSELANFICWAAASYRMGRNKSSARQNATGLL